MYEQLKTIARLLGCTNASAANKPSGFNHRNTIAPLFVMKETLKNSSLSGSLPNITQTTICYICGILSVFVSLLLMIEAKYYSPVAIIFICLSFGACVAKTLHVCISRFSHPVLLTCLIYMNLFYLVPGMVHMRLGAYPFFNQYYAPWVADVGALIVFVFSVTFFCGYGSLELPTNKTSRRFVIEFHYGQAVLLLAVISILSGLIAGYGNLMATRGEVTELALEPSIYQQMITTVARISPFLAFLISLAYVRIRWSVYSSALVALSVILFLPANSPLAIPRYILGSYLISTIFLLFPMKIKQKFVFVGIIAFAQFTIFPLASDAARGEGAASFEFAPIRYISTHGDFDGFQSTLNVVEWTSGAAFQHGRQLLSAAFFFVPRSFAPWKSIGTGGEAATYVGYPFINISAPLPSELYVDFGFPGLVILSFAIGRMIRKIDIYFERHSDRFGVVGRLLPAIVSGYAFILMRGSLVGVLGPFAFSCALVLLVNVIFLKRTRILSSP